MKLNEKEIAVKDIDCDDAIKRLMDYLDDYLKDKRKSELEKHLASCHSCLHRYEFQRTLKTKISSLADQSDPALANRLKKILSSV